jgi:hypothetical protein
MCPCLPGRRRKRGERAGMGKERRKKYRVSICFLLCF